MQKRNTALQTLSVTWTQDVSSAGEEPGRAGRELGAPSLGSAGHWAAEPCPCSGAHTLRNGFLLPLEGLE